MYLSEKEQAVLEVELRRKIYQVVRTFAGAHFREIERKAELGTGSVQYHLSFLVKRGLIESQQEGKNVRYFPKDFSVENKTLMSFLRQRSTRSILLYILAHAHCNHEAIVQEVKLSPSTVSFHLKKLEEKHIIKATKEGRKTAYELIINKEELIDLLITYQASFLDNVVDNIVEMWS